MATRTSPLFTADPTGRIVTLHLIDASGDLTTVPLRLPIDADAADIEAYAAFYQAATNTSLWMISDLQLREGAADPDNATAAYRGSVKDGINLLFKDLDTAQAQPVRVVAPVAATMQGNQDIPLLSSSQLTNVITSVLGLLPDFDFSRAQFTERRERSNNPVIK